MAEDADADTDDGITISIGTEHEFLIRYNDPQSTTAPDEDEVANVLTRFCIPGVVVKASSEIRDSNIWRTTRDCSIEVGPDPSWDREPTQEEEEMNANPQTYIDIEVVSKGFPVRLLHSIDQPRHEWDVTIPPAISVLQGEFRVYVNESMGTHVSMGTGVKNPQRLNLLETQKLGIFFIVYEPVLDFLFAPNRRGNKNEWCMSNSQNMYFTGKDTEDIVREIAGVQCLDLLVRMMCPYVSKDEQTGRISMPLGPEGRYPIDSCKYYKLSLDKLRDTHPPYVVEWRQCEGTVDMKKVSRVIAIFVAIRQLLAPMTLTEVLEKHGDPNQLSRFWEEESLRRAWGEVEAL